MQHGNTPVALCAGVEAANDRRPRSCAGIPCHPRHAVPPQNMYAQLRQGGAAGSMVSWRRMFDFLLSICQLYSDIEADTRVTEHLFQMKVSLDCIWMQV